MKSSADLLQPFRSLASKSPSSNGDLKKYFLKQKIEPETNFDFDVVEESLIEASKSKLTAFDKIDEDNRSVLKDKQSQALSQSLIQCDLIRLERLE